MVTPLTQGIPVICFDEVAAERYGELRATQSDRRCDALTAR